MESGLLEVFLNWLIRLLYIFWWLLEFVLVVLLMLFVILFGLLDWGGVDNILKFIGWGEWVGDELVDDMMKLGFLGFFEEFFFGVIFFLVFVLSGNLLLLGLGVGRKFFFWYVFVSWWSCFSWDVLNWRWDWVWLGVVLFVLIDDFLLVKWFFVEEK